MSETNSVERPVVAPAPKREVFAWECNVRGKNWQHIINHRTAGKARYQYLISLRDAGPEATLADITVRKVGPAHTSDTFRRTAIYRGRPELTCGARVEVFSGSQRALGVIVGHNSSANFDVLFDEDTYFKGGIGNVHPGEIRLASDNECHNAGDNRPLGPG
jgi:hypothetical protein